MSAVDTYRSFLERYIVDAAVDPEDIENSGGVNRIANDMRDIAVEVTGVSELPAALHETLLGAFVGTVDYAELVAAIEAQGLTVLE